MISKLIWVGCGGALGAMARYLVVVASHSWFGHWPLATLLVNVAGSLSIGLFSGWLLLSSVELPTARLVFQTGFLGAFTTFSAFSLDTLTLWSAGQYRAALLNILLNVGLCLIAVATGFYLAQSSRG